jgi:hypothetical protein
VYRWLHREGCDLGLDPWQPFASASGAKAAFDGNAAVPWRIFRTSPASLWNALGFEPPSLVRLNGFAYLLSLGFTKGCLLPRALAGPFRSLDTALQPAASWLGMRAALVWRRAP